MLGVLCPCILDTRKLPRLSEIRTAPAAHGFFSFLFFFPPVCVSVRFKAKQHSDGFKRQWVLRCQFLMYYRAQLLSSVIMGEKSKEIIQETKYTPQPFNSLINMPSKTLCERKPHHFYSGICLTTSQIFHPHLPMVLVSVHRMTLPPSSPWILGW